MSAAEPTSPVVTAEARVPDSCLMVIFGASGDLTLNLTSGAYARDSLIHVPATYDPTKGTMLVVNYHGYSSNAAEQIALA